MERTPLNDWMTLLAVASVAGIAGATAQAVYAADGTSAVEVLLDFGGWAAAIATLLVGIYSIRPLTSQAALQEARYNREAADRYLVLINEAGHWLKTIEDLRVVHAMIVGGGLFKDPNNPSKPLRGPDYREASAEQAIAIFRDAAHKAALIADQARKASYPGTRNGQLPVFIRSIESAFVKLYAGFYGLAEVIDIRAKIGNVPQNGDTAAWNSFLSGIAKPWYPQVTDPTDEVTKALSEAIRSYLGLLNDEIVRHR